MQLRNSFFLLVLASITSGFAIGQVDTAALSNKLRQNKEISKNVVCLVMKDGKPIYKKETPDFNGKTQHNIGATSQWLTAALVMTYVQEGKLSLDDKVSDYIPVFTKYSKGYITIRHCLTHNTGIQSDPGIAKLFQKTKFKSLEEEAMAYASKKEIETNPGTEFKYSNIGYNLVGRILEIISKKGFDRLAQDRVLRPLGMRGTSFSNDDYNASINPSLGARSTANDLSNFMAMILNKGTLNNKKVLTEESVATLISLQAEAGNLKNVPKSIDGLSFATGSWVVGQDVKNIPTALAAPSLTGTWPIVDLCRGYTLVVLTKDLSNPPPKEFYLDLKSIVDAGIPSNCR